MPRTASQARRRDARIHDLKEALASIYTPSTPIEDPSLFSGRTTLLADLNDELTVEGQNIVLYGERGVGKTSLCRVLLHGRRIQNHSASTSDDFVSIFLRVLEGLGEQFTEGERKDLAKVTSSVGVDKVASVGSELGEEATFKPVAERKLDLNLVIDRVAGRAKHLDAVVIDELQNLSEELVQTQIMEVVKGFADRKVDVKLFLVGVADSDDDLIPSPEYAQYKGRHFQIRHIPRMEDDEVRDILEVREKRYSVRFDDQVKDSIVGVASGYPATAHRLALRSAQAWAGRAALGFASIVPAKLLHLFGMYDVSVKKAGVHVEQQDLRRAVDHFVQQFGANHPAAAKRYDDLAGSQHREHVERLLVTLASAATTRVNVNDLASRSGFDQGALESLVESCTPDLIQRESQEYRLVVRELRPYIEARRYLASGP